MEWLSEPKSVGWYWYKGKYAGLPGDKVIVLLKPDGLGLGKFKVEFPGVRSKLNPHDGHALWAGPLVPPPE